MKNYAWIIDTETISNMFMLHAEHYKNDEATRTFVIHELRNDYILLINFLESNIAHSEYHIGFNNIGFDSQVIEFILKNKENHEKMTAELIARDIYTEAQRVISNQSFMEEGSFKSIPEWKLSIKQIDLYQLGGYSNPARKSSLKWLQYSMDWLNMQEMPLSHKEDITTLEQIETVISYCINDVKSTKELFKRSQSLLEVRKKIKEKYKLDCYSFSDTKLGSELLLSLYCQKTGKNKWETKKMSTKRDKIEIKDILFPYLKFKSLDFIGFHEMLKKKIITETKNGFKYSVIFKGYKFDFAQGGLHQCIRTGIYEADDKYIIKDFDVAGLYPSIACVNKMFPAHLGKEFFEVYKNDIVDVRLTEKAKGKDGDKAIIDGYKQAGNSCYG